VEGAKRRGSSESRHCCACRRGRLVCTTRLRQFPTRRLERNQQGGERRSRSGRPTCGVLRSRSATPPLRDQILESEVRMATHHPPLSPEEVLGRRATLAGRAVPLRAGAEQKLPHQEPILEAALANLCDHPQLTDQAMPPIRGHPMPVLPARSPRRLGRWSAQRDRYGRQGKGEYRHREEDENELLGAGQKYEPHYLG
jgi:hypothetical protein